MKIIKSISALPKHLKSPYPNDKDSYQLEWDEPRFFNQNGKECKNKILPLKTVPAFIKTHKLVGLSMDDMLDSPAKISEMFKTLEEAVALLSVDGKYVLALSVTWDDGQTLLVPEAWKKIDFEDYQY